jgi:hypothetical protein
MDFVFTSGCDKPHFTRMKIRRKKTKSAAISNSRWLAYATAGAATALSSVTSAEAEIHYSGIIDYKFHGKKSQYKDFELRGFSALFFQRNINYTGSHTFSYNGADDFFQINAQNGSVAGFFYTCAYSTSVASVSNLDKGDVISQRPFVPGGGILMTADGLGCGGGARGQFLLEGIDFIGFKFDRGHGVQYGWARIKKGPYPQNRFEVVDYAYGDPGEAIAAGQKRSALSKIPAQGSLGLLALGATGLFVWRKGRHGGSRASHLDL